MTDPAPKKPMGRPSPIDAVIATTDTGAPITVADRIAQLMRVGCYFETACAAAGIHRETGNEWLKIAGRARIQARGRDLTTLNLTPHQTRCVNFSDAVLRTAAEWESRANATLQQLAIGGHQVTDTVVKYNAQGVETERTVTTKTLAPNPQVLEWRLTRRFPHRYADRLVVSEDDPEISEEEHASDLVASLVAFQESKAADAKDTERPKRKRAVNGEGS